MRQKICGLEMQRHQLDHIQSRSRQITTPTTHRSIFTDRVLFLTPNQQCQSTEVTSNKGHQISVGLDYRKSKQSDARLPYVLKLSSRTRSLSVHPRKHRLTDRYSN